MKFIKQLSYSSPTTAQNYINFVISNFSLYLISICNIEYYPSNPELITRINVAAQVNIDIG